MLRRRKEDTLNGKVLIELPDRNVNIISCPFDAYEQSFYDNLESKMEGTLDKIMKEPGKSGAKTQYMAVLTLLLRLRQGKLNAYRLSALT
jgi:hypothetical protein